jgi:hypothetical protein
MIPPAAPKSFSRDPQLVLTSPKRTVASGSPRMHFCCYAVCVDWRYCSVVLRLKPDKRRTSVPPKGYFDQSDPFGFSAAFLSAGNLFPSGLKIDGHPASGDLWVNLPRATFVKLQGNRKLVLNQVLLNKGNSQSFARFFRDKSNAAQIPWIFGPASLIPVVGTVITIATSTIDGLQRIAQGSVNSDQLAVLMAAGGVFQQTIAPEGNDRLVATVFYSIKIGIEARMYAICSSIYGLNVVG